VLHLARTGHHRHRGRQREHLRRDPGRAPGRRRDLRLDRRHRRTRTRRLPAGVFFGGEYSGANPLATEAAPRETRGLYSGIINTGFPPAYAAVSLITLLLLLVMSSHGPGSAYAQWGWRIPFVIGAIFYAFCQAGLSRVVPFDHTGIVLLLAGVLLVRAGALPGPETKDVTFTRDG
jgi:MFS family permease